MFNQKDEGRNTLVNPSRESSMKNISFVIHRHITDKRHANSNSTSNNPVITPSDSSTIMGKDIFALENFLPSNFNYIQPTHITASSFFIFNQYEKKMTYDIPTITNIHSFLQTICDKLDLSTECAIIALIYIERLLESNYRISPANWRMIIISALLTASKVWNDDSAWNIEFSQIFPILSIEKINIIEGHFLNGLNFNLYISSSDYAKYYFALRELGGGGETKSRNIPKYYMKLKLNLFGSKQVQHKTIQRQTSLPTYNHMASSV